MARRQVFVQELVELFLFIPIQRVNLAIERRLRVRYELDGVVPGRLLRHFVKVLLGEQVAEGSIFLWYHLFERFLRLVCVCGRRQVVCVVYRADHDFFVHSHCEDRVSLLEFLVPFIIGI